MHFFGCETCISKIYSEINKYRESSHEMLNDINEDLDLFKRIITSVKGGGCYEVETEVQSSLWELSEEPRSKKAGQVKYESFAHSQKGILF